MFSSDRFLRQRRHDGAAALAALVVGELLHDHFGILSGQVGRIRPAHALCAVAHGAVQRQRGAAADRGRRRRLAPSRAAGRRCVDTAGALLPAVLAHPLAGHAGGAADAVPQTLPARKSACAEGSQPKPTSIAATVSATRPTMHIQASRSVRPQSRVLASSLSDRNDRHEGLRRHRQLHDRIAVVDDGERDHHRHPQAEAIEHGRRLGIADGPPC